VIKHHRQGKDVQASDSGGKNMKIVQLGGKKPKVVFTQAVCQRNFAEGRISIEIARFKSHV